MSMIKKMATAGAVAVMGLGLGAASASAYAISGGSYVGTASADHSFTVGGAYTIECPAGDTTFTGNANGTATTSFTPAYGSNCSFFGLPAQVTQSGTWSITVNAGPDGLGWYTGSIHIPSGSVTTIEVPLAGCTVTVTGTQSFAHGSGGNVGRAKNVTGGTQLEAAVNNIAYTASGCPFSSGSDGTYNTNGPVNIPGVTVS